MKKLWRAGIVAPGVEAECEPRHRRSVTTMSWRFPRSRLHLQVMLVRRALAVFASIAVLVTLLASCGAEAESRTQERTAGEARLMVEVAPAERSALPDVVAVSGTLAAQDTVVLGT